MIIECIYHKRKIGYQGELSILKPWADSDELNPSQQNMIVIMSRLEVFD